MMTERAEVRRRLAASPARVFAAFSDPVTVSRWLRPSPEITLSVRDFDFREGGKYQFAYHMPNDAVMVVGGCFTIVQPPSKLAFTWVIEPPDEHAGIQSMVVVTIDAGAEGSLLVIRHLNLEWADAISRHVSGWRGAVDLLTSVIESGGSRDYE